MLKEAITGQELEALVNDNEIVFIDFWAPWCAPCKSFAQVYAQVAEKNPDILFAKINIDQESELAETFQIQSIPHLIIFKQGIVIYSESGSIPESALSELVEQARQVDLSKVEK